MTAIGVVMLFMALVHDLWMPASPAKPTLWPYGAAACGLYFGVDMLIAGASEAWDKVRGKP